MTTTRPSISSVAGRTPGSGPVIAVLTDGPTDPAVAARAADLAGRTGTLLILAPAVPTGGPSPHPALQHLRDRRTHSESIAIAARVNPILHATGVAYFRTTLPVPIGSDPLRALPATAVRRLVDRFGAVAVVTARPLHDPAGVLRPAPPHPGAAEPADRYATR